MLSSAYQYLRQHLRYKLAAHPCLGLNTTQTGRYMGARRGIHLAVCQSSRSVITTIHGGLDMGNQSLIELNTAILCAALLFTKPLFRRIRGRLSRSNSGPRSVPRRRPPDQGARCDASREVMLDTLDTAERSKSKWKGGAFLKVTRDPVSASESQEHITRP